MAFEKEISGFKSLLAKRDSANQAELKIIENIKAIREGKNPDGSDMNDDEKKEAESALNKFYSDLTNIKKSYDGLKVEFEKLGIRAQYDAKNPKPVWLNEIELRGGYYFGFVKDTAFVDDEKKRRQPGLDALLAKEKEENAAKEEAKHKETLAKDPKEKERLRLAREAAEAAEKNAKEEAEIKAIKERTQSLANNGPTKSGPEVVGGIWGGIRGAISGILKWMTGGAIDGSTIFDTVEWLAKSASSMFGVSDKTGKMIMGGLGGLILSGFGPKQLLSKIPGVGGILGTVAPIIMAVLGTKLGESQGGPEVATADASEPAAKPEQQGGTDTTKTVAAVMPTPGSLRTPGGLTETQIASATPPVSPTDKGGKHTIIPAQDFVHS